MAFSTGLSFGNASGNSATRKHSRKKRECPDLPKEVRVLFRANDDEIRREMAMWQAREAISEKHWDKYPDADAVRDAVLNDTIPAEILTEFLELKRSFEQGS